ncbi:MAG: hypothetical protein HY942_02375 [Gammaproteobacteria bacterium]|nr:hypothetical protein [Gammaproteobacteria bacterium]
MKDGAQEILGKTIKGIVIKTGDKSPKSQLFLVFDDGTYYEFYSLDDVIQVTGGVSAGDIDTVRKYMSETKEIVFESFPKLIS